MTTRTREAGSGAMEHDSPTANGKSSLGTVTSGIIHRMPGDLDGAGDAVSGAVHAVSKSVAGAPDENVLLAASLAAGVAIGLLVGGAPRLLAAGTVATSVALGAALLGRRPGPSRARLATSAA